ncbi:hypothetical protein NDU88_002520, partial [Pleurodeles waltl]
REQQINVVSEKKIHPGEKNGDLSPELHGKSPSLPRVQWEGSCVNGPSSRSRRQNDDKLLRGSPAPPAMYRIHLMEQADQVPYRPLGHKGRPFMKSTGSSC